MFIYELGVVWNRIRLLDKLLRAEKYYKKKYANATNPPQP